MVRIVKKNGDVVWVNPNLVELVKENYIDVSVRGDTHLWVGDTEVPFDLKDNINEINRLSHITSKEYHEVVIKEILHPEQGTKTYQL